MMYMYVYCEYILCGLNVSRGFAGDEMSVHEA